MARVGRPTASRPPTSCAAEQCTTPRHRELRCQPNTINISNDSLGCSFENHGGAIPTFSRGVPWGVPATRHEHAVRTFRRYGATLRAIIDAPAGHCGGTDVIPYAPPRCANEELGRGGWHLRELIGNLTQTGPLAAAGLTPDIVARCAAACAVCSTCAFFSVNLYNDDCSWYASCDLFALSTTPGGYRTFQMPLRGVSQTAIRAKEKRRPKSAVKRMRIEEAL